jgi:hypothetical protein
VIDADTPQAHLAAALPTPGRTEPAPKQDAPCADEACEHRTWGNPTLAPDYMDGGR